MCEATENHVAPTKLSICGGDYQPDAKAAGKEKAAGKKPGEKSAGKLVFNRRMFDTMTMTCDCVPESTLYFVIFLHMLFFDIC